MSTFEQKHIAPDLPVNFWITLKVASLILRVLNSEISCNNGVGSMDSQFISRFEIYDSRHLQINFVSQQEYFSFNY